jgi:hypothetical protein
MNTKNKPAVQASTQPYRYGDDQRCPATSCLRLLLIHLFKHGTVTLSPDTTKQHHSWTVANDPRKMQSSDKTFIEQREKYLADVFIKLGLKPSDEEIAEAEDLVMQHMVALK